MPRSSLLDISFSDLQTLRSVYDQKSFSRAAELLDVNQSAVSYTIEKLRKVLNDRLFFRQGGQVVPTDRCEVVYRSALSLLGGLDDIAAPENFDPLSAESKIVIACNFLERQIILPHILRLVRQAAPGLQIETLNSISSGHLQLQNSEADLLIGPLKTTGTSFLVHTLMQERYVCVMDPTNPLCANPLTLEDYISANHAVVLYGGGWRSGYLRELDEMKVNLPCSLSVPSPAGLDRILAGTDLICTVPLRIAKAFEPALTIVESPCPAPFDVDMVWTSRTDASPMHRWFREQIISVVVPRLGQVP